MCVSSKNLLLRAVESGGLDTVKALIEKGEVDVNAYCYPKTTSLLVATTKGHIDTVKALIEARADINRADNDSQTALDLAQKPSLKKGGAVLLRPIQQRLNLNSKQKAC